MLRERMGSNTMLTTNVDDSVFRNDLAALYRRLGDLTEVMSNIGGALESRIKERFETRRDPSGQAWAPWSQSTIDSYPDDGNRTLLDRSGDMLEHISHQPDSTSVRVGFAEPYAAFHEWGTKHMPRRGLMFADPDAGTLAPGDELAVLDILSVWLDGPD
jgi:phage virion morphogenesis protein